MAHVEIHVRLFLSADGSRHSPLDLRATLSAARSNAPATTKVILYTKRRIMTCKVGGHPAQHRQALALQYRKRGPLDDRLHGLVNGVEFGEETAESRFVDLSACLAGDRADVGWHIHDVDEVAGRGQYGDGTVHARVC